MKKLLKKFFNKEDGILFYVGDIKNNSPYMCESLDIKEDKDGWKYIQAYAYYNFWTKRWVSKKVKVYFLRIDNNKLVGPEPIYYMENNLLKKLDYKMTAVETVMAWDWKPEEDYSGF